MQGIRLMQAPQPDRRTPGPPPKSAAGKLTKYLSDVYNDQFQWLVTRVVNSFIIIRSNLQTSLSINQKLLSNRGQLIGAS